ncbi:hypothetical protein IE4771_CH02319 [Rhizobium etli bv. mimosae str. IE4771]|uniref:Uncharacterized protein n=1 Tax=Rhizobium etli bv. mimosae str. IE4771 TaxID=1432050 RepID=A0A060I792_RHIET|nr:hypothetical protein IE4771_CH02319 [Rhizobium sp. IE4771]
MDAPSDYKYVSLSEPGIQSVRRTDIAWSRCDIPPADQNDTDTTTKTMRQSALIADRPTTHP